MKRKFSTLFLTLTCLLSVTGGTACDKADGVVSSSSSNTIESTSSSSSGEIPHEHTFEVAGFDDDYHWLACTCGEIDEKLPHVYGAWQTEGESHWKECACGDTTEEGTHVYGAWQTEGENHWKECVCGDTAEEGEHAYGGWQKDSNGHWKECTCGEKSESGEHDYKTTVVKPTCVEQGYTEYVCAGCNDFYRDNYVAISSSHNYGTDNICDDCRYVRQYTRVNASGVEDATGTYVLFGSYPQNKVSDSSLTATLNTMAGAKPTEENDYAWSSYGYYIGTGSVNSQSKEADYMWYQDVTYSGEKYRGVYFSSYRPLYTDMSSSTENSAQDENGYATSTIYWFKYQPVRWKILEEVDGYATLLCEMLVDAQEYNYTSNSQTVNEETVYANNYEYSTIRAWLNANFYNTAFTALEQEIVQTVTVDNSAATTANASNGYACADTQDKVWLLSYQEVTTYFNNDESRKKKLTDYALCQGGYTWANNDGYWFLRSPVHTNGGAALDVDDHGEIYNRSITITSRGICPALKIRLL